MGCITQYGMFHGEVWIRNCTVDLILNKYVLEYTGRCGIEDIQIIQFNVFNQNFSLMYLIKIIDKCFNIRTQSNMYIIWDVQHNIGI